MRTLTLSRLLLALSVVVGGVYLFPAGYGPLSAWWLFSRCPCSDAGSIGASGGIGNHGHLVIDAAVVTLAVIVAAGLIWHRRFWQGAICIALSVLFLLFGLAAGPPRWAPGALWPGGLSPIGVVGLCLVVIACLKATTRSDVALPRRVGITMVCLAVFVVALGVWSPLAPAVSPVAMAGQFAPLRWTVVETLAWWPVGLAVSWLVSTAWEPTTSSGTGLAVGG